MVPHNVIIEKRFRHAFKQQFDDYAIDAVRACLQIGRESCVPTMSSELKNTCLPGCCIFGDVVLTTQRCCKRVGLSVHLLVVDAWDIKYLCKGVGHYSRGSSEASVGHVPYKEEDLEVAEQGDDDLSVMQLC